MKKWDWFALVLVISIIVLGIYFSFKIFYPGSPQEGICTLDSKWNGTHCVPIFFEAPDHKLNENFCGSSMEGYCETNSDCVVGGCSSHVCGNLNEMGDLVTTCEFRECYRANVYGVSCGCFENKCAWKNDLA